MELDNEKLNNEYLRLKSAIEKYKTDLEESKGNLKLALKDKENAENALKSAKTDREKKKFQADLNKVITAINDIKSDVEVIKSRQEKSEDSITMIMNELKSRPEVQAQYKRAIEVRAERQIARWEKQKEEQKEKKGTLEQFKNIIAKHPQAQIFVNNIENKSLEISKRELEIKNLDKKIAKLDPKDSNYATDKAKLDGDKAQLEYECRTLKSERQSERDGLKKLLNNPKYNEHIDNLTTRNKLDKDINNADRLIRRSENKIKDYQYAKDSLYEENQPYNPPNPLPPIYPSTKWQTFKNDIKSIFSKKQPGDPSRFGKIGKTIKNLFSKQANQPVPTPEPAPEPAPISINSFKDEIKLDGDIMKYEAVQDLYKQDLNYKVNESKQKREDENCR